MGIDRSYLGFEGNLNKGQIRKLRRACHSFVSEELMELLKKQLDEYGVDENLYQLVVENTQISDQDPEVILVNYKSLYEGSETLYLQPKVKIEVSARSLIEPYEEIELQSWVDGQYPDASFTDVKFPVSTTDPQKTFLEKLILLHEEFQKPTEKIRHFRMSRHFYDIGQILKSDFGKAALKNQELFDSIITHRKALTPMKTTDYDTLTLKSLNVVPPEEHLENFKADNKEMIGSMIQGESREFENLMEGKKLTGANQVWVSDITYIRTERGFCYLSLITDLYTRKIMGYYTHESLELEGCLKALDMATKQAKPEIHHSDRGSQYWSKIYTQSLKKIGTKISMTENGNCYENAVAERINGILKNEFNLSETFKNIKQVKKVVEQAVKTYNQIRPSWAIDLKTPNQMYIAA